MTQIVTRLLILFFFMFTVLSCGSIDEQPPNLHQANPATNYKGNMAHEWVQITDSFVKENQLEAPHIARIYGYVGLTIWESVYNGIPDARSMAGQINDYPNAPEVNTLVVYDWAIVMCAAMRIVLPELVDGLTTSQRSSIIILAEKQEETMLANNTDRAVFDRSKDFGEQVAQRIVKRIGSDGRDVIRNIVPQLPVRDGAHPWYWDRNTFSQQPVEPMWGTLRTFVLDNSQLCAAQPPHPYATTPGTPLYQDALEVRNMPKSESNKRIAYHFEDGPGRTSGPAGHWVSITKQLLEKNERDLAVCAKAYCLVGLAVADGYSAAWYLKYKYNLLRPATYITENIDPTWVPLIATSPHPDFVSAAALMGGAVPVVLVSVLEDRTFVDRTHLGSPLYTPAGGPFILPERQFETVTQCGIEMAESRVVSGSNFRRATAQGLETGRCVGSMILGRLEFGF